MRSSEPRTDRPDLVDGPGLPVTEELNQEIMRFVRLLKASAGPEAGPDRSALLLLWPLMHAGPMRVRELAAARGSDASTVSRQAAQLVRAGLVRRDLDPDDRRACRLALTEGGRGACQQLVDARRQAIDEALRDWDPHRVRIFTELFRDFNCAVEAQQRTSPGGFRPQPAPTGADASEHSRSRGRRDEP